MRPTMCRKIHQIISVLIHVPFSVVMKVRKYNIFFENILLTPYFTLLIQIRSLRNTAKLTKKLNDRL